MKIRKRKCFPTAIFARHGRAVHVISLWYCYYPYLYRSEPLAHPENLYHPRPSHVARAPHVIKARLAHLFGTVRPMCESKKSVSL